MSNTMCLNIENFEQRLGLKKGFSFDLLAEDDWSFLIKLSALVEAACTHTLASRSGHPELEEAFAYLDQANSKVGRISMLNRIGALHDHQAEILTSLSELRNKVAHDIKNVNFRLNSHIGSFDINQLNKFVKQFGHSLPENIEIADKQYTRDDFVFKHPKYSIWSAVAEIIACLYLEADSVNIALQDNPLLQLET